MRDVDLSVYLPQYYRRSALMAGISAGLKAEFGRLFGGVDALARELNIKTASDYLGLWERSVGLPENPSLTAEERRSRVLARLRQVDTTTPERIRVIVQSYARGDVEVIENYTAYTVTVKFTNRIGKPDNMAGIIEQLERIMPAHLAVSYVYPYRTWGELKDTGKTWGQLYEAGHTWRDLMEKEAL